MTDCIFCDPSKLLPRTITQFSEVSVVATLGQITEGGYLLLIPTTHTSCLGALDKVQIKSFDRIVKKSIELLKMEYPGPVTIFEHGIVGQTIKHAHLHLLPAGLDLTEKIVSDFPTSKIEIVDNLTELQALYQIRQEPYLLWSTFYDKYLVCWNPSAPAQYLRTITAELLGVPERANWKNMDPEKDKALVDETMGRLKPLFSTITTK